MSIRAHRVNKIERAGESFNLHDDKVIMDYLDSIGKLNELNEDLAGFIDISVDDLKEILQLNIEESLKNNIKTDIEYAEKTGDDYVLYYCY